MPRQRRIFIPGLSIHVIQRGNNRSPIFSRDPDYEVFLRYLQRSAQVHSVAVHGYVLMTNHFHLIATPALETSLPDMMRLLGTRYVLYFNRSHDRIGTLWNGRYRSLRIDDERYWLTCLRYIEQNPVRAGMVGHPAAYRWSSYRAHASETGPGWLSRHHVYDALGSNAAARQSSYRAICQELLTENELSLSRHASWGQTPLRPSRQRPRQR